jgi:hypothetical protein
LKEVNLPVNWQGTIIPENAFANTNIKSIYIPESIVNLKTDCFKDCVIEDVYISDLDKWC